jgi:hypothetical protein
VLVAVITIRFGPASPARNGKLELVLSTKRDPRGHRLEQRAPFLGGHVGADQVELGRRRIPAAVADQHHEHQSSALVSFASRPNTLRTLSAVASQLAVLRRFNEDAQRRAVNLELRLEQAASESTQPRWSVAYCGSP